MHPPPLHCSIRNDEYLSLTWWRRWDPLPHCYRQSSVRSCVTELVDNGPSVCLLTGPNWCHAALSSQTMVVILFRAGESVSGCKEWPVWGKRRGCPIWPPHSDWTVWQSGGGRQRHKGPSVCLYTQNLSVIVGDTERKKERQTERKKGIDGEGWEMEGQRGWGGCCRRSCFIWLSRDGTVGRVQQAGRTQVIWGCWQRCIRGSEDSQTDRCHSRLDTE